MLIDSCRVPVGGAGCLVERLASLIKVGASGASKQASTCVVNT